MGKSGFYRQIENSTKRIKQNKMVCFKIKNVMIRDFYLKNLLPERQEVFNI